MTRVLRVFVLLAAPVIAAAQNSSIQPIASTRVNKAIDAYSNTGDVVLAAREMLVDLKMPSGRVGKGGFLILFDPTGGYYFWSLDWDPSNHSMRSMIDNIRTRPYVARDRLAIIYVVLHSVVVQESTRKAATMDAAEAKSLEEAKAQLGDFETPTKVWATYRQISLIQAIGDDFLAPPMSSIFGPVTILNIVQQEGKWHITLEGQWKAELILNDKYEVVDKQRLN